jgi:hypothetical protein
MLRYNNNVISERFHISLCVFFYNYFPLRGKSTCIACQQTRFCIQFSFLTIASICLKEEWRRRSWTTLPPKSMATATIRLHAAPAVPVVKWTTCWTERCLTCLTARMCPRKDCEEFDSKICLLPSEILSEVRIP